MLHQDSTKEEVTVNVLSALTVATMMVRPFQLPRVIEGESQIMTLENLICAGCGTGNGGGVGCAGGKVVRNPTLPPAQPPLKEQKGGPPLSSH